MMLNLRELEELATNKPFVPSFVDDIQFAFWDRGVTLAELNELPIPYIMKMMNTFAFYNKKKSETA